MKKALMMYFLVTGIYLGTYAQKVNASKVPARVKAAFEKQYPGTTAKWELENGKYEAGFKKEGQIISVLYDAAGVASETETDIKISDLPATVREYVKQHYSGKKVKEAAKIVTADGTITYEAEINNKDVLFDSNGKFLKEAKD